MVGARLWGYRHLRSVLEPSCVKEPHDVKWMALALCAKMTFIYHPMLMALEGLGKELCSWSGSPEMWEVIKLRGEKHIKDISPITRSFCC